MKYLLIILTGCSLLAGAEIRLNNLELFCDGRKIAVISPTREKTGECTVSLRRAKYKPELYVYMATKLPARNLRSVSLTDAVTGKMLQEGIDFKVNPVGGVYPPEGVAPRKVKAKFTFLPERYDILSRQPDGTLRYLTGPERDFDAEEHIPELPGTELLATIAVRGEEAEIVKREIPADCISGREYLQKFLVALKPGRTVRVMGYGDSITALQVSRPGFEPGGVFRDRCENYFRRYDAETRRKIPVWQRDGVSGQFVKAGWNWGLVEQLKKQYRVKVEYLNAGIGSTYSASGKGHGLDPERLGTALAAKPDLVLIAFGMNELSSPRTTENVTKIARAFQQKGAVTVIVGVPRCQSGPYATANAHLKAAARASHSAFIDLGKVHPGVAPRHYCAANQFNHPGITELAVYRQVLASLLQ